MHYWLPHAMCVRGGTSPRKSKVSDLREALRKAAWGDLISQRLKTLFWDLDCKNFLEIRNAKRARMFRQGIWRSFKDLMFRGALSLTCCAIAALCVGGLLSALAENLGPKPPANVAGPTACKTVNCVLKGTGSRLAHSGK